MNAREQQPVDEELAESQEENCSHDFDSRLRNLEEFLTSETHLLNLVIGLPSFINGRETINVQSFKQQDWHHADTSKEASFHAVQDQQESTMACSTAPLSSSATLEDMFLEEGFVVDSATSSEAQEQPEINDRRLGYNHERKASPEVAFGVTMAAISILPDLDSSLEH